MSTDTEIRALATGLEALLLHCQPIAGDVDDELIPMVGKLIDALLTQPAAPAAEEAGTVEVRIAVVLDEHGATHASLVTSGPRPWGKARGAVYIAARVPLPAAPIEVEGSVTDE